jgi:hypothetical protein
MRRILLLLVLLSVAGFVAVRLRERAAPAVASEPTWPPITPRPDPAAAAPAVGHLADGPSADPASTDPAAPWKPVNADGTLPDGYPIKAKNQSMIFHVPGGRFYDRTTPERCYATEAAAIADGFRRSKT